MKGNASFAQWDVVLFVWNDIISVKTADHLFAAAIEEEDTIRAYAQASAQVPSKVFPPLTLEPIHPQYCSISYNYVGIAACELPNVDPPTDSKGCCIRCQSGRNCSKVGSESHSWFGEPMIICNCQDKRSPQLEITVYGYQDVWFRDCSRGWDRLQQGVVEVVKFEGGRVHYLLHQPVVRFDKDTTRLRRVWCLSKRVRALFQWLPLHGSKSRPEDPWHSPQIQIEPGSTYWRSGKGFPHDFSCGLWQTSWDSYGLRM